MPAKDARLYIRSTLLDDGWTQPVPGPDLTALQAVPLAPDRSPDIKHTLRDPVRGVVIDGVEFDEDITDEEVRQGDSFVSVQLHNRGSIPTSSAKIALLWAPADDGPPDLPDELWAGLLAGTISTGDTFGT